MRCWTIFETKNSQPPLFAKHFFPFLYAISAIYIHTSEVVIIMFCWINPFAGFSFVKLSHYFYVGQKEATNLLDYIGNEIADICAWRISCILLETSDLWCAKLVSSFQPTSDSKQMQLIRFQARKVVWTKLFPYSNSERNVLNANKTVWIETAVAKADVTCSLFNFIVWPSGTMLKQQKTINLRRETILWSFVAENGNAALWVTQLLTIAITSSSFPASYKLDFLSVKCKV